tara:strand:+ start:2320 stop:2520 length:201 start_codon:yes stop_codon:yes gene_type:complete
MEIKMTKEFFESFLVTLFGRKTAKQTTSNDYETWARIEYRDDYDYALYHMQTYGRGPSYNSAVKGI